MNNTNAPSLNRTACDDGSQSEKEQYYVVDISGNTHLAVVAWTGHILHAQRVHSHPAGSGTYCRAGSPDPGATDDPIGRVRRHVQYRTGEHVDDVMVSLFPWFGFYSDKGRIDYETVYFCDRSTRFSGPQPIAGSGLEVSAGDFRLAGQV